MERAIKLAGKNPVSQSILNRVILYTAPMENIYMSYMDQLGLYSKRIELLYIACERDLDKFLDTVSILYDKAVSQDIIVSMKTQEEFNALVREECQ